MKTTLVLLAVLGLALAVPATAHAATATTLELEGDVQQIPACDDLPKETVQCGRWVVGCILASLEGHGCY